MKTHAGPFVLGLILGPLAVFLHEIGHVLAASSIGATSTIHLTFTDVHADPSRSCFVWVLLAGPAAELFLSALGLAWLFQRRHDRVASPANLLDWVATFMAGFCLRWLTRVPFGTLSGLRSGVYNLDEAFVSERMGAAPWFLPLVLLLPAVMALVFLVRQHPPGSRLVPLLTFFVAQGVGLVLWKALLAPFVFG